MVNCSILGCKNRSERKYENITFHSFPSNIEARKLWIKAAGRRNWRPSKYSRICSDHFEAHCLKKKKSYNIMIKGSIPKLFLPLTLSSPETVCVKEEPETEEWDGNGADEAAALYAEHEVKEELVISPEQLQPQDIAYAMQAKALSSRADSEPGGQEASPGEASGGSCGTPVVLNYCYVRLERIVVDKELHPCKICLKIFVHKSSFMTHTCLAMKRPSIIFKDTGDGTSFQCNNCGKLFGTETKLKTHVLIHTTGKENQLSCQPSSDQVLHKPEKAEHQKNQSGNKPYTCDICYLQFDQKTNLTTHRLTHAVEKLHTCDICSKQFTQKSFLDTHHQLNHTGQNPYTCNICKKQFTQRSSLFRHRTIHTGEKPYTCDVCGKQFLQRSILKRHLVVHTAKPHIPDVCKKNYTCHICNEQFLNVTEFTKHMSNHTVKKPLTCDICYKQFSRQYGLNKHMLIHAEGEPYTCNLCNKQFSLKYYLDTHRLIHNKIKALYI